jgi:hypothetical protein
LSDVFGHCFTSDTLQSELSELYSTTEAAICTLPDDFQANIIIQMSIIIEKQNLTVKVTLDVPLFLISISLGPVLHVLLLQIVFAGKSRNKVNLPLFT